MGSNQNYINLVNWKLTLGLGEKRKKEKGEESSQFVKFLEIFMWILTKVNHYKVCVTFIVLGSFTHAENMLFQHEFVLKELERCCFLYVFLKST